MKTHCINCYSLETIFLMTGKKFSMTGKWPGIIFVDENGHPDFFMNWERLFEKCSCNFITDIKKFFFPGESQRCNLVKLLSEICSLTIEKKAVCWSRLGKFLTGLVLEKLMSRPLRVRSMCEGSYTINAMGCLRIPLSYCLGFYGSLHSAPFVPT